jgi:hypothetical protein
MGATRFRFLRWHCLPSHPGVPLERNPRRLRLVIVIVIALTVAGGATAGIAATETLLTISGIVAAAAMVSRYVLRGATPSASSA